MCNFGLCLHVPFTDVSGIQYNYRIFMFVSILSTVVTGKPRTLNPRLKADPLQLFLLPA